MADEKSKVKMEDIVSLCKRRGFIFQGSEVYGGLAGTWDYGPLGLALKKNIMNLWWKMFVEDRDDMYGVDAAILMNQKVWQASGHVDTFTDPLVECNNCKSRFRVDHVIKNDEKYKNFVDLVTYLFIQKHQPYALDEREVVELKSNIESSVFGKLDDKMLREATQIKAWENLSDYRQILLKAKEAKGYIGEVAQKYMDIEKMKCPSCKKVEWLVPKSFRMMFKTNAGPVALDPQITFAEGKTATIKEHNYSYLINWQAKTIDAISRDEIAENTVYLRPETAQGIFTNYKNVLDAFYPDLPFGIAQQGKAFRNEISPRDFVFRSREFEQMEIEYFVREENWEKEFDNWVKNVYKFLDAIGIPKASVHELPVPAADRAHYSKRTIDFEFDFPHKRDELLGLAYRTDFDLMNIQKASGKSMEYRPKDGGDTFVPHVIEPSFGVERALMAVLVSAYTEDEVNGEKRVYLKLPVHIAPVKVAVSPLLKNKPELVKKAREVYDMLKKEFGNVMYDDNGNIGKRYRRQDEIGTPYCVVVDFDTLKDDTVTVRHRDTTKQERVPLPELINKLG